MGDFLGHHVIFNFEAEEDEVVACLGGVLNLVLEAVLVVVVDRGNLSHGHWLHQLL